MKICSKCKRKRSFDKFYKNPSTSDGFRSECKLCCDKDNKSREHRYKKYRKQYTASKKGIQVRKNAQQKYYSTIKGHLGQVFNDIKQRCDNPDCKSFKNYGGRGIQNNFVSLSNFRKYIINKLQIDPRKLQIDRIDNNGNYEPGNIRFVTSKINNNNKRNSK